MLFYKRKFGIEPEKALEREYVNLSLIVEIKDLGDEIAFYTANNTVVKWAYAYSTAHINIASELDSITNISTQNQLNK